MAIEADAQSKIDAFLNQLRRRLRGLERNDVREIIDELRSHIVEKAAMNGELNSISVEAALAALGDPRVLAEQYLADNLLSRSQNNHSPLRLLAVLWRWASLSAAGVFVLTSALIGYFLAASLFLCGLLKLIHPHAAGIWTIPDAAGI